MAKVTGIGGVFFRSPDAQRLQRWYVDNLGLEPDADGYIVLRWGVGNEGSTVWTAFDENTEDHFGGSDSDLMINYRVDDLDALVDELSSKGIEVDSTRFEDENGRFAHCWDLDGNKVQLWEPAEGM